MASESRDLLGAYKERLRALREQSGIAGGLLVPLQMQADLIEAALRRQTVLEERLGAALEPLGALGELARDAPATLRTQAKAFEAASASFKQAADVLNLQAELLERTFGALGAPVSLLRAARERDDGPDEPTRG